MSKFAGSGVKNGGGGGGSNSLFKRQKTNHANKL